LHKLLALPSDTLVLAGHTSEPVPFDGIPIAARLAEIIEAVEIIHAPRDLFIEHIMARISTNTAQLPPDRHAQ